MSILEDFATNEIGWTQVINKLGNAHRDLTQRAAEASGEEHLDLRGQMRGIAHALTLIDVCRKELRHSS